MNKKEKVECLMDAGLTPNESKVLCWIIKNKKGVTREIEHDECLRQPEVCVVTRKFEKKGWISHRDIKGKGKGRPQKEYSINGRISIDNIISDLEKKQSEISEIIKKLREEWWDD